MFVGGVKEERAGEEEPTCGPHMSIHDNGQSMHIAMSAHEAGQDPF